jgi:hypothetical protein
VEQSTEWITARVTLDEPNVKSLALLQIAALKKLRDLLITKMTASQFCIEQAIDLSARTLAHYAFLRGLLISSFFRMVCAVCAELRAFALVQT